MLTGMLAWKFLTPETGTVESTAMLVENCLTPETATVDSTGIEV